MYTAPVGRFRENGFGLHDMLGNVWEWICSEYEASYNGKEQRCINDNRASGRRVLRGGSWLIPPRFVRAALRNWSTPDFHYYSVGFRLARNL